MTAFRIIMMMMIIIVSVMIIHDIVITIPCDDISHSFLYSVDKVPRFFAIVPNHCTAFFG